MIITHVQRISLWLAVLFACAYAQGPMSSSSEEVFGEYCLFGEYCFAEEMSKDGIVWKWEKYKGNKEYLFSYIPCSFKGSYSFDNNTNDGPLFGYMLNTSVYNDKKPLKCSKENFDSREYISLDVIRESTEVEQSKLNKIKDSYYDVNWEITYDSNYVRLHHSGSTKIYISGFCAEEQLEIIRKRKKK